MSRWGLIDNSLEGRQKVFFPHFSKGLVPVDPDENRRWRQRMFTLSDRRERAMVRRMCREDFLFYLAGFVYLFDAGIEEDDPGPVPFIPYDFQVEMFTELWRCMHVDRQSLRVKKPRNMGLTWMFLALFEHCWHFQRDRHLLVGSRREEEVDGSAMVAKSGGFTGEWSKLLPKIDFIHVYQPSWLWPEGYRPRVEPYRSRMKVMNPETGSIIWGTSSSGTAGRSGRGYGVLWDEAAHTDNLYDIIGSLSEFSPFKAYVSSIGDLSHAFSTVLKDSPEVSQLSPEWWMHPVYNREMTIDPDTGEKSSPWLVRKLEAIANDPLLSNQEYFADESKQVGGFYHSDTFLKLLGTSDKPGTVCDPRHVGMLDVIDTVDGAYVSRFVEQNNGRWRFWMEFGPDGKPPRGTRYKMGCDIAAGNQDDFGRGASNSVLVIVDHMTGDVVAEFVTHGMRPELLARVAAAAARWFEGDDFQPCKVSFERNGPGAAFGVALAEQLGESNIQHDHEGKLGWFNKGESAQLAFSLHQQMICDGRFRERGADCVSEMRFYKRPMSGKGAPIHSASVKSADPSGSRENHGDRTIARVVVCRMLVDKFEPTINASQAAWGSARAIMDMRAKRSLESELV